MNVWKRWCGAAGVMLGLAVSTAAVQAEVKVQPWGTMNGQPVHLYTLHSGKVTVVLSEYGARLVRVETPDRKGTVADILLGFPDVSQYGPGKDPYFGPIVGRFGNRLDKAHFSLGGKTYRITANEGPNALHGGVDGFDRRVWTAKIVGPESVEFTLVSPDGDQGFPGQLTVHATYALAGDQLSVTYAATTTKATVVNLTSHGYWNLHGAGVGTVLDQDLQIDASHYLPVDAQLIPTGQIAAVAGTPFDFRTSKPIGRDIREKNPQLKFAGDGYDHNWVLDGKMGVLHPALRMFDPQTGRTMSFQTTEPGLQFYSGNGLAKTTMSDGKPYPKYGAAVLETQHFPDSPNHTSWPSTEILPGQTLRSKTVMTFGVAK